MPSLSINTRSSGCETSTFYNRPAFLLSPDDIPLPWPVKDRPRKFSHTEDTNSTRNCATIPRFGFDELRSPSKPCQGLSLQQSTVYEPTVYDSNTPFPAPPTLSEFRRMEVDAYYGSISRMTRDVDGPFASEAGQSHQPGQQQPLEQYLEVQDQWGYGCQPADASSDLKTRFNRHPLKARNAAPGADDRWQASLASRGHGYWHPESSFGPQASYFRLPISFPDESAVFEMKTITALADWVTGYMFELFTSGRLPDSDRSGANRLTFWRPTAVFESVAYRVKHILLSTHMPQSAVFLALWYAYHLPTSDEIMSYPQDCADTVFLDSLFGSARLPAEEYIVKTFVVGMMLADKWVNDDTFKLRTWNRITGLGMNVLRCLEIAALGVFKYNLAITPPEWHQWMAHISHWHTCMGDIQLLAVRDVLSYSHIGMLIEDIVAASRAGDEHQGSPETQFLSPSKIHYHVSGAVAGYLVQCCDTTMIPLPSPTNEWSPECDPVLTRPPRTIGTAPCADYSSNRPRDDLTPFAVTYPAWPTSHHPQDLSKEFFRPPAVFFR